jgi:hypothetical protein
VRRLEQLPGYPPEVIANIAGRLSASAEPDYEIRLLAFEFHEFLRRRFPAFSNTTPNTWTPALFTRRTRSSPKSV